MHREFRTVTEIPSDGATADQFQIMYTRYALAVKYAEGKDVLEVACGAGVGLGLLARVARRTVAGDIDERNLAVAHRTYAERSGVALNRFDAQSLPFRSASFDVVLLYEALYYLPAAEAFFREAWRVLRPGGTLLTSTVNCRWAEFNPSPFSVKYYDAVELSRALESRGFGVEMYASFPASNGGVRSGVIGALRRFAVSFHLIPRTMKGKQMLKRLFYGRLRPIPTELAPDCFPSAKLERLELLQKSEGYRFLYAVGTRKDGDEQ